MKMETKYPKLTFLTTKTCLKNFVHICNAAGRIAKRYDLLGQTSVPVGTNLLGSDQQLNVQNKRIENNLGSSDINSGMLLT